MKNYKTNFQDIHYNRLKPSLGLKTMLQIGEFFYSGLINFKNFLYEIKFLKEKELNVDITCVGNLTTGGVGKTPIVTLLANEIAKTEPVCIISRGYGAKISTKKPVVIKDFKGIRFDDGSLCGDEPFQLAKKVQKNVVIIICPNRVRAIEYAIVKYGIKKYIMDDGFSNRKLKKNKTFLVIDSKMRFGNNHLLPMGPLREPIKEIKRANEIVLVDKSDENFNDALIWAKNNFNLPLKICKMKPKRIYNSQTGAQITNKQDAIAFCAIGQPDQFYNYAKEFYNLVKTYGFEDHHKYDKNDIKMLLKIAQENDINTFITTQKDETKLINLVKDIKDYNFNVLELENELIDIE